MTRCTRLNPSRGGRRWQTAGVLLLVALATTSCKKVALTAPTGSTLQLYASRTTAGLNSSVAVTAVVIESGGTPVHDGTSVSFFSTLGTMTPATALTSNGQATSQLVTDTQSGTAEVSALSGSAKLSSTVKVTVGAVAVGSVALSANPTSLSSKGGTSVLTATVSDSLGNRIQGVLVSFTSNAGSFDRNNVATDANGQASVNLTTSINASVTAAVAGGSSGSVTSAAQVITVRTPPTATIVSVAAQVPPSRSFAIVYSATAASGGATLSSVGMTFGDGTSQSNLSSGSAQTITHVYTTAGTFTIVLTVIDVAGEQTTASTTVVVQ